MAQTQIKGTRITDGTVQRVDLDTTTSGQSVIAKLIAGRGVALTSSGADAGTGDVTINTIGAGAIGAYSTGNYFDNNPSASVGTLIGAADRIDICPFFPLDTVTIDQIGCAVSTAVAGSLFKVVIYDTGSNGWANNLLLETVDISGAATGYASASVSFTFQKGILYWVGVRHSSTCTLRCIAAGSAYNLGLTSSSGATQATVLRRSVTYATGAPNPWTWVIGDLVVATAAPSIRCRAV